MYLYLLRSVVSDADRSRLTLGCRGSRPVAHSVARPTSPRLDGTWAGPGVAGPGGCQLPRAMLRRAHRVAHVARHLLTIIFYFQVNVL